MARTKTKERTVTVTATVTEHQIDTARAYAHATNPGRPEWKDGKAPKEHDLEVIGVAMLAGVIQPTAVSIK